MEENKIGKKCEAGKKKAEILNSVVRKSLAEGTLHCLM